jgi:hypothetical protein
VNKTKKIRIIKLNKIIQLMIFKLIMINFKTIINKVKRNRYKVCKLQTNSNQFRIKKEIFKHFMSSCKKFVMI